LIKVCPICNAILVKSDTATLEKPAASAEAEPEAATTTRSGPSDRDSMVAVNSRIGQREISGGRGPSAAAWNCPNCAESVPNTFDVCWKCGTSRDGTLDPSFAAKSAEELPAGDARDDRFDSDDVMGRRVEQCPRCGSQRMIVGAPLTQLGPLVDRPGNRIMVAVSGDPKALIFKDRLYVKLWADICGDCGHAELRAEHFKDLYDTYLKSQGSDG
jgi:hypothetical protein